MAIAPGPYKLWVLDQCEQAYENVLRDCVKYGVTRDMLQEGLTHLKADCDLGRYAERR